MPQLQALGLTALNGLQLAAMSRLARTLAAALAPTLEQEQSLHLTPKLAPPTKAMKAQA
jgi:hypothetical protein